MPDTELVGAPAFLGAPSANFHGCPDEPPFIWAVKDGCPRFPCSHTAIIPESPPPIARTYQEYWQLDQKSLKIFL